MHPSNLCTLDFRYLNPPLEALSINHKSEYIKHGEKKKIVRKIFHFVNYDSYENEKIKELYQAIHDEKISLPQNWLESDTLKYCYTGKFKMPNCIKQIKKHLEWLHNDKIQILTEEALNLLKRGVIYAYGRDRMLRPIIVFDLHKINYKKDKLESVLGAFSYLLTTVYEHMFLPGYIENWLIIIDIDNMSIMNVPFKLLAQVIDCMSNNYVSTCERLYILNPSSSLFLMWKIIEAMMDPETVQKIKFLKKANFHDILEMAEDNQIQEKYGGKLENLTEFWPPVALIDVRKDIPIMEIKRKEIKERLVTGCQLTNCLPPKKPEPEQKFNDEFPMINTKSILQSPKKKEPEPLIEPKNNKYEPKLNSPLLSDLMMDSPTGLVSKNDKIDENVAFLQNNNTGNQNKSIQSLPDTSSTLSLKNEVFEISTEIPTVKQNLIKMQEYEIISEKNELEEREVEDLEQEKETVSQPKTAQRVEPIYEREEKSIKCQPCKECVIF